MRFTSSLAVGAAALWASASAQEVCEDFVEFIALRNPANNTETSCANTANATVCQATCSEGFYPRNADDLEFWCSNGIWENGGDEYVLCIAQCEPFNNFVASIPFAAADQGCANVENSKSCPLVCQEGYTPVSGSDVELPTYYCLGELDAAVWTGNHSCVAKCPSLSSVLSDLNLQMAIDGDTECVQVSIDDAAPPGELCFVRCVDGYERVDNETLNLECTNGVWGGAECRAEETTDTTGAAYAFAPRASFALVAVAALVSAAALV